MIKVTYRDASFCFFDAMKKVRFNSGFDWSQVENCSILVLPELGSDEDVREIISAVRPGKVIFTRHYLRYQKDKIRLAMALSFPDMEYYRTAHSGAIICETRGKDVQIETTLR